MNQHNISTKAKKIPSLFKKLKLYIKGKKMSYHRYPQIKIQPLNFDDTDDEHDENSDPATSTDEDVKINTSICCSEDVKVTPSVCFDEEKMLLDESTYLNFSSDSITILHKNLQRPDYAHSTPGPTRVNRKRKYGEGVSYNTCLSHMPNEILSRVFSFCNKRDLLAFGSTCKRFYDVTSTQEHWAKLNLSGKKVIESALHRIITRKTKSLCMTNAVVFLDPLLSSRKFSECSLTRLDLSWAKFPGSDLSVMKGILSRCKQLQYLGLENQMIDAEVLELVAENHDLLVLNLSTCQVIDATALSHVFKSCNKLKDLNLSWTYPDDATSAVIINEIPTTIEKFAIAGMVDRPAYNDTNMLKLLSRLPSLTELDIGDNCAVTSVFILELGKRKNFQKLTACRCYGIEPLSYTTMKYVRVMNLHGAITATGYDYMRSRLPNVTFNLNPFATIGRSQDSDQYNILWGEDISELY
jgi:hypothetical protein|uniref:F-box domain-containing protein n=1 Tax=Panagrolaimus sp. PS1159 TaxID=55785 RepID=A0AC35ERD3_9BILA